MHLHASPWSTCHIRIVYHCLYCSSFEQWDELYRSKPDADYEDPAIVAAIKEAQENMGDFKLKSADDYIVPEKERVNADKKRAQIIQLKEQVFMFISAITFCITFLYYVKKTKQRYNYFVACYSWR